MAAKTLTDMDNRAIETSVFFNIFALSHDVIIVRTALGIFILRSNDRTSVCRCPRCALNQQPKNYIEKRNTESALASHFLRIISVLLNQETVQGIQFFGSINVEFLLFISKMKIPHK